VGAAPKSEKKIWVQFPHSVTPLLQRLDLCFLNMSHISPGSYLVWTLLTFFLFTFFIYHLWNFDRFKSIRWNSGTGAFKRVMVYTYTLTVPMIFCYVFGFVIIKYKEGFVQIPGLGTIPLPYEFWSSSDRNAIFPLMLMFSFGWSLEMVTHLEELCFWLFLINATAIERNWFRSPYFKTWVVGSVVAILYMPLITIFTRANPLKSEAYTFLAGSLGSLSLTIWFIPILWAFPGFLENLRSEGVDKATVVRLTKFSELNIIRVTFRFLFTIPIAILGIDGIRPHIHINENLFATDFLVMIAGIGCVVSSAITLVIFFPRSVEGEIAARDATKAHEMSRRGVSTSFAGIESRIHLSSRQEHLPSDTYLISSGHIQQEYRDTQSSESPESRYNVNNRNWTEEGSEALPPLRPIRRKGDDVEMGLTEHNLTKHNSVRVANVNPMVSNYTSPIDIASYSNTNEGRLTFAR